MEDHNFIYKKCLLISFEVAHTYIIFFSFSSGIINQMKCEYKQVRGQLYCLLDGISKLFDHFMFIQYILFKMGDYHSK